MSIDETVADTLGSLFQDKFNAREYIANYYPEIVDIDKMLEVAELMHKNIEGHYEIDDLAKRGLRNMKLLRTLPSLTSIE